MGFSGAGDTLDTTCPGLGFPHYKSRLLPLLTVHSRPPFPFTFARFLPPVNSGGAGSGQYLARLIWGRTRRRKLHTAFHVLIRKISAWVHRVCVPRFQRQDRPAEPLTADRERKPSAGRCRRPHRQGQCSCRPHSNSTPAYQAGRLFPSAPVSCGKGNRPACVPAAASLYRVIGMRSSILLSIAVLPKRSFARRRKVPSCVSSYQVSCLVSSFAQAFQNSLAPLLLLSPQSHAALRGPRQ